MPALSGQHLRKAFGPQVVLEDASFSLARGEKVGLIGANGAGKSTLVRILAGLEAPDGGTMSVRRGLSIRYLAQEPELDPNASARQVVEDALTAWRRATNRHAEVTAQLDSPLDAEAVARLLAEQAELDDSIMRLGGWDRGHEALGFLDLLGIRDVDRPCGARSGGERRRIALAQMLVVSPDIAILDEPTNHLDADTASWLEGALASSHSAIVLVTHDRYFLDALVDRIVELERGRLTSYEGGYGAYLDKKAELSQHEERVEQNRQNALRREREWLSRGPKARGTKQKARIDRARSLEAQAPATAGRPGEVTLTAAAGTRQGKTILELRGVALGFGGRPLNEPFHLIVGTGERIGIVGPNGAGKTTLLRAVVDAVGAEAPGAASGGSALVAGTIVVGKNTRVSYLDQSRAKLDDSKSIFDDVRGDKGGTVVNLGAPGLESLDLRKYLELFLFDAQKQRQKVGSLSGGERARVALAKILRDGANLLVLDEPTNDLDLPTLAALEGLLDGFAGSVLVVTHDRAFLDRVATSILAFESGPEPLEARRPSRVTRYAGGYSDYIAQRGDRSSSPPARPVRTPEAPVKAKPKAGLTHAERDELDRIVGAIDVVDAQVSEVEALLSDPTLYSARSVEVAGLQARLEAVRAQAAALTLRWEALEAKRG
jgi:ATP-binding cassette subfamily F protein uup